MAESCTHCGSQNLTQGVPLGFTAEVTDIGPQFRTGVFAAVEPLRVTICRSCGTIVRWSVAHADRNWLEK